MATAPFPPVAGVFDVAAGVCVTGLAQRRGLARQARSDRRPRPGDRVRRPIGILVVDGNLTVGSRAEIARIR